MNRFLVSILCLAAAASASVGSAADVIPPELVGVWATESSLLKGPLLIEGQALYLSSDGRGALIGGPPPVSYKIVASFDAASNAVEVDLIEQGQTVGHRSLSYDAAQQTIDSGEPKHQPLRRRFDALTETTRQVLGL